MLDKKKSLGYNNEADFRRSRNHLGQYGGVTQLVEYPVHTRSVTCSSQVAATRPVGQAVKTPPFHGGNMGSIPVRVTKKDRSNCFGLFLSKPQGLAYHHDAVVDIFTGGEPPLYLISPFGAGFSCGLMIYNASH